MRWGGLGLSHRCDDVDEVSERSLKRYAIGKIDVFIRASDYVRRYVKMPILKEMSWSPSRQFLHPKHQLRRFRGGLPPNTKAVNCAEVIPVFNLEHYLWALGSKFLETIGWS